METQSKILFLESLKQIQSFSLAQKAALGNMSPELLKGLLDGDISPCTDHFPGLIQLVSRIMTSDLSGDSKGAASDRLILSTLPRQLRLFVAHLNGETNSTHSP